VSDLIIKIGDDALDLKTDEVIAITKQAAKVGDFSAVLADGTNEVSIPATARNKSILDNSELLQTESELPYRRNDATLIQEGYETIQDGFALIESFGKDFRIQLVGGNASFFNLIKDLNLRDLNLTVYDHFWTNANVFANRNNTSGFIYALFEQSDQPTSPTLSTYGVNLYAVQTELLLPVFYEKTLIAAIFAEQGYSFVADITSTNLYDKAVLFAASTPNRGTDSSYLNLETAGTVDINLPYNVITNTSIPSPLIEDGQIIEQQTIYWSETTLNSYLLTGRISHTGNLFETYGSVLLLPDATRLQVTFTVVIENPNAVSHNIYVGCAYTSDAGDLFENLPAYLAPPGTSTQTFTFDLNITQTPNQTGYFFAGENGAFFTIYHEPVSGTGDITIKAATASVFTFEFISAYNISTTLPYTFLRGFTPVPDMKQGDFLKDVAKKYQLIYDVDELTHTVYGRRFDKVKENIIIAKDLSAKLHDDEIETTFRIDGYAQTNYLKWKEDDITKWTAQGIINVDDTTLEAEKTVVQMSQFAASSAVSRFDTKQVPYIPLFDVDQLPTNGMTDRMLIVRSETFPYNINFNRGTDLPTDTVTFAYFAEAGNEDSLDFPTLITRFYVALQDMLYRAKTITCKVKLGIKDVMDYNPFIPVYIQKFNAYFYWEKLENYVKDKLTRIKIIRL